MAQVIPDYELTPAMAAHLMLNNRNRSLRKKHVARLARDITAGRWRDYSVIKVANVPGKGEVMIDGQHRCAAVLLSERPIRVVLIKGLDIHDQDVTDTGITRSLGDVLRLKGEHNTAALAGALGWVWRRENKLYVSEMSPSVNEALELLEEHPKIRDTLGKVGETAKFLRISQGMSMALYYEMCQISQEAADDFWDKLRRGADLPDTDAIFLLRQRLLKNARNPSQNVDRHTVAALISKAWNHYIHGIPVKSKGLRWRRGGPAPEPFPLLEGFTED